MTPMEIREAVKQCPSFVTEQIPDRNLEKVTHYVTTSIDTGA